MNCLIDYIGVLGCGSKVPDSGLYINQLAGITLKSIDSLANSEQVSWPSVWKDVQTRAAAKFQNAVNTHFSKKYKLNSEKGVFRIFDENYDNENVNFNDVIWRGFTIRLSDISEPISVMTSAFIEYVEVYNDMDGVSKISVFDLDDQTLLYTSGNVSFLPGVWTKIHVNREFTQRNIFVAYDSSDVSSYDTNILVDNASTCNSCDYGIKIQGAYSDDLENPTVLSEGENSFGLTGRIVVGCSYTGLVCHNKHFFSTPWMYLLGAELMIEALYSERFNAYTTFNRKQAEELKDFYETEFEKALTSAVKGLTLSPNDKCFHCESGEVQQVKSVM